MEAKFTFDPAIVCTGFVAENSETMDGHDGWVVEVMLTPANARRLGLMVSNFSGYERHDLEKAGYAFTERPHADGSGSGWFFAGPSGEGEVEASERWVADLMYLQRVASRAEWLLRCADAPADEGGLRGQVSDARLQHALGGLYQAADALTDLAKELNTRGALADEVFIQPGDEDAV